MGDNTLGFGLLGLVGLGGVALYLRHRRDVDQAVQGAGQAAQDFVTAPFQAAGNLGQTHGNALVEALNPGSTFISQEEHEAALARAREAEAAKANGKLADWLISQSRAAGTPAQPDYLNYDINDMSQYPTLGYDPRTGALTTPGYSERQRQREQAAAAHRRQVEAVEAERKRRAGYRPSGSVVDFLLGPESERKRAGDLSYRGDGIYTRPDGSYYKVRNGQIVASGSAGALDGLKTRRERQNADYWPGTKYLRSVVEKYRAQALAGSKASNSWLRRYAPSAAVW